MVICIGGSIGHMSFQQQGFFFLAFSSSFSSSISVLSFAGTQNNSLMINTALVLFFQQAETRRGWNGGL